MTSLNKSAAPLLAGLCWLCAAHAVADLKFELEAGPATFGEIRIEGIRAVQNEATTVKVDGITHARFGPLGNLDLVCTVRSSTRCDSGRLTWAGDNASPTSLEFERRPGQLILAGENGGKAIYRWTDTSGSHLEIQDFPVDWIPRPVIGRAGLADLSGSLTGRIDLDADRVRAKLGLEQLAFDTPDGRFAGGGLAFDLDMVWALAESGLQLDLDWTAGELLLGPAYLPPPGEPVSLELTASELDDGSWRVEDMKLFQAGSMSIGAAGRISLYDDPRIAALDLDVEEADIASLWRHGLNSLAGALGWRELEPSGRLAGWIRMENVSVVGASLNLSEGAVEDGAERLSIDGLGASISWDGALESLELGASWDSARLLRIPLGASALAFRTDESGTLALADAFRLPVLDGALIVERFQWRDWASDERQLAMDARLEPINLSVLTRTLGWTEFGGRLSGRFPGIRLSGSVIDVQGGLDIDLFGGSARINSLSVERPFGSLPALAAEIEFDALDLEQVTGAFEFGRMLGLMSGHIKDLRLLDWQPVRFDAWFETLEHSPQREISQKAVGSISSLSGGGSAAISGTLLRWFDDFPYRKAGLGCRLAENVCRMRGLRDTENGGYLILDGRLIPRLDIVGYQRRVDWPRLLAQLAAATESAN